MHDSGDGRHLDAADVLFEIGRRTQAAALMMRKHQVLPTQQLCECGRVATRVVPAFGLRCDVAGEHWDLARATMSRFLTQIVSGVSSSRDTRRPTGTAKVASAGRDQRRGAR